MMWNGLFRVLLLSGLFLGLSCATAFGLETATYSLGWVPMARDAGFFVAQEKGWYRRAGVDIKLVRGYGAGAVAKDVGAGAIEFGHADPRSVVLLRNQGADIRMVALIHAKNMYSIFTLEGSPIRKPKDLEGRTLGAAFGEASFVHLPVLATANHIDIHRVKHIPVEPAASIPSLVAGKVDAITLFTISLPVAQQVAAKQGKKVVAIPYADFGVDVYTSGIAARDRMIRSNRSLAEKFIATSMKAMAWAVENSKEALTIFHKHVPAASRETSPEIWQITVDHLLTPEAKKYGIGYMTQEKWEKILEVTRMTHDKPIRVSASDLYTNEFLPRLFPKAP